MAASFGRDRQYDNLRVSLSFLSFFQTWYFVFVKFLEALAAEVFHYSRAR